MATVKYTNLDLKLNKSTKKITYNGQEIEVLQYLPIEEKESLINITLQESKEGNIYNSVKKDIFFHMNLVFAYTNITFTDKQRQDIGGLYDKLTCSGLLEEILNNIPESEYQTLYSYFEELEEDKIKYDNTILGVVKQWISDIPKNTKEMEEIVKNFNPENFQAVLDFAKAANGNRDISTD